MVKYLFEVEGMMCKNCEKHVVESIKKAFPSAKVTASYVDKKVEVATKKKIDENLVVTAIQDRGYDVKSVKQEEVKNEGIFSFLKK